MELGFHLHEGLRLYSYIFFLLQSFHEISVYGSEVLVIKNKIKFKNHKKYFSWNKLQMRKLLPFSSLYWDAGLEPSLFSAHPGGTGACHLWRQAGNQDPTSLWESQQHSPFRSSHQLRNNKSIKYSWEGKGLKKGTC